MELKHVQIGDEVVVMRERSEHYRLKGVVRRVTESKKSVDVWLPQIQQVKQFRVRSVRVVVQASVHGNVREKGDGISAVLQTLSVEEMAKVEAVLMEVIREIGREKTVRAGSIG